MSGTLDPGIARGFNPGTQQGNPLQQFGQVVQTAGSLAQLRRENEMSGARRAIGNALQNAMNPATGEVDHRAFSAAIAGNPMAGFMAPQALAQARALQQGGLQVEQAQAALGMQRLNNLRLSLVDLAGNPDVTREDIVSQVGNFMRMPESERPFSAQAAASALASLPRDPEGVRRWLMGQIATTDRGIAALSAHLPRPQAVQTGGATQFVDMNPLTNPNVTDTRIPNQPGVAERNQFVQRYNPQTQRMELVPRQEAGPMVSGVGTPAEGTVPGAGTLPEAPRAPRGQDRPVSGLGSGRYGGDRAHEPRSGAIPAGPSLGEATAAELTAQRSAEQGVELQRQADQVPTIRATLGNMQGLLRDFSTGPGAAWTREAVNAWNRVAPSAMQIRQEGTAAQEEFVKLSAQLAQQQFQALGGTGTNAQLESTMRTSPHEALSRMGNQSIIALLQGNADAIAAKNAAWQAWQAQNGPGTYGQFSASFNRDFDPRVFQAMHMSSADRHRMVGEMSAQERERFNRHFRTAVERGWIRLPQARSTQAPPAAGAPRDAR